MPGGGEDCHVTAGLRDDLIEPDQAAALLWLATLPNDGPTGGFWHGNQRLDW